LLGLRWGRSPGITEEDPCGRVGGSRFHEISCQTIPLSQASGSGPGSEVQILFPTILIFSILEKHRDNWLGPSESGRLTSGIQTALWLMNERRERI
jgi:hypothetical protein